MVLILLVLLVQCVLGAENKRSIKWREINCATGDDNHFQVIVVSPTFLVKIVININWPSLGRLFLASKLKVGLPANKLSGQISVARPHRTRHLRRLDLALLEENGISQKIPGIIIIKFLGHYSPPRNPKEEKNC